MVRGQGGRGKGALVLVPLNADQHQYGGMEQYNIVHV